MTDLNNVKKHVPGYVLHEVLGGGAMSIVFRATEETTRNEKAIKLLRPEHLDRADLRQRFEREAKISAEISHPHIIKVEKYDIYNNIPYMVMPLLDHNTLGDRIEKDGPLPVTDAVTLAIKIIDALSVLHRENVIHRDLKAENILYTFSGEPVLTDLGLAYAQLDTRITSIGTGPLGTPQYMAPEQWMGDPGDRKSDIFSAGVLLFYTLTGTFPFPSRSARAVVSQIINGIPDKLPTWIQPIDLREDLQAFIFKAVSSEPDARFNSAREMEQTLRDICFKYDNLFGDGDTFADFVEEETHGKGRLIRRRQHTLTDFSDPDEDEVILPPTDLSSRKRQTTDTNLFKELTKEVEILDAAHGGKGVGKKPQSKTGELLTKAIISTLQEQDAKEERSRHGGESRDQSRGDSQNEKGKNRISNFGENRVRSEDGNAPMKSLHYGQQPTRKSPQRSDLFFQDNEGDEVTEVISRESEQVTLAQDLQGEEKEPEPKVQVHKVQLFTEKPKERAPKPTKDSVPMPPLNDETNPQKLAINPVEIAPGSYWVGKRTPGDFFFANPYLRTFKGNNEEFNLIIDPGSSTDFAIVQAKCSRIIGNLSKINATFINHQDPDVGSSVGPLIGRYSPGAYCLCTEDTWRLVHYYNIPRERFVPLEKYPNGFRLPTGHKLIPVPSPFCHFVGAIMIYDPETCVLYSGDLFGGLTDKNAKGLWADESDWVGVRAFHQIYMPTRTALTNAIANIRNIKGEVKIIAPQHGRLLTGDIMHDFMERLSNLSCGLDILSDRQATPDELLAWTTVLNRVLKRASDFTTEDLYAVVLKNGALDGLINETSSGIEVRKMGKYTLEQALRTICTTLGDKDIEGMIKYEAVYATSELGLPTPNMDIDEGGVPHSKGSMLGSVVD